MVVEVGDSRDRSSPMAESLVMQLNSYFDIPVAPLLNHRLWHASHNCNTYSQHLNVCVLCIIDSVWFRNLHHDHQPVGSIHTTHNVQTQVNGQHIMIYIIMVPQV